MALRTRNILSLCAGVGGLELGILLALDHIGEAGRGIVYVEREDAAAASLVASMEAGWLHHAPVWSDMRTFDARPWRGLVHILASGDPCQDNSVAGKRAGKGGERFLAAEVTRLAEECRPDLVVRENVPGNADEQLEAIAPALEGLGYRVAAGIFSSAEAGNTMRRERLFIMAVADGGGGGDGSLQCGGELGLFPQGDAASGADNTRLGCTAGEGSLPGAFPGVCRSEEGRGPWDAEPQRRGEPVEVANGRQPQGRRSADEQEIRGRTHCQPSGSSDGMDGACGRRYGYANEAICAGRNGAVDAIGDGLPEGGQGRLAGASSEGSQGRELGGASREEQRIAASRPASQLRRALLPPTVIPGPTDSRWIDVLDRFPELQPALSQEEAESHLRRGVDAVAHRVERLRATGNGVDPVVAAYAFLSLGSLLGVFERDD